MKGIIILVAIIIAIVSIFAYAGYSGWLSSPEPNDVVELYEHKSTETQGFNITLMDASSGWDCDDNTATYKVTHIDSNDTTYLVLSRCANGYMQYFKDYTFELDRTSQNGAVLNIYKGEI